MRITNKLAGLMMAGFVAFGLAGTLPANAGTNYVQNGTLSGVTWHSGTASHPGTPIQVPKWIVQVQNGVGGPFHISAPTATTPANTTNWTPYVGLPGDTATWLGLNNHYPTKLTQNGINLSTPATYVLSFDLAADPGTTLAQNTVFVNINKGNTSILSTQAGVAGQASGYNHKSFSFTFTVPKGKGNGLSLTFLGNGGAPYLPGSTAWISHISIVAAPEASTIVLFGLMLAMGVMVLRRRQSVITA